MATAKYFKANGDAGKKGWELPEDPFDGIVNEPVLHQAVKAYLANQRQGTASTKTRAQVAGGNRKIWRQKGTGRARQGSIRAPHWRGGGIVFGPTPRSYNQELPKKVRALARRSAFNVRANADQISVLEGFDMDAPKTRRIVELLDKIGIGDRKVLILTNGTNSVVYRSARNLQNVSVAPYSDVSAYEVLNANELLIEEGAFGSTKETGAAAEAKPAKKTRATAEAPAAKKPRTTKKKAVAAEEAAPVEATPAAEQASATGTTVAVEGASDQTSATGTTAAVEEASDQTSATEEETSNA